MPESMPAAVTVEHEFAESPATVWVALSDPVTARDALPGCTSLAPVEGASPPGSLSRLLAAGAAERDARTVSVGESYDATVTASVRGVDVEARVHAVVTERDYPEMAVEADVDGGDDAAKVTVTFSVEGADDGGCRVTWTARAGVEGPLTTYGRWPVEATVARVANEFFERVDARLDAVAGPESERAVKDPDWRP